LAISKEHHSLWLFQEALRQGAPLKDGRWAFLGNQRLRGCPRENPDPLLWKEWWGFDFRFVQEDKPLPKDASAKLHSIRPWMEFFGAKCVMWDSNGKDGAIQHDLNLPVEEKHFGQFDVVTNFGTSEHVSPNQMPVFQTMHDLCDVGGLMLHAVPSEGCNRHGDWRYSIKWFDDLADTQEYQKVVVDLRSVAHNRGPGPHYYAVCMFRKIKDQPFRPDYWLHPPPSER